MIPRIQDDDEVDISSARWILVVEKEVRLPAVWVVVLQLASKTETQD